MTVEDLFLIILSMLVILFIISYAVYVYILKTLEKKGYKYPKEEVRLATVLFYTGLTLMSIAVVILLIYKIIVNWNVVI